MLSPVLEMGVSFCVSAADGRRLSALLNTPRNRSRAGAQALVFDVRTAGGAAPASRCVCTVSACAEGGASSLQDWEFCTRETKKVSVLPRKGVTYCVSLVTSSEWPGVSSERV